MIFFLTGFDKCSLGNYMFGPALDNTSIANINTLKECFDQCYSIDNCTHFSWESHQQVEGTNTTQNQDYRNRHNLIKC